MFVKALLNEYLVLGKNGRTVNRGLGASAFIWPGSSYLLISSSQQEAKFEMTQETKDGIPLRFKGLVIYRVIRPEAAAQLFDFSAQDGHPQIQAMLSHLCLGELRATVAHMTMAECIEQRKTTLTDVLSSMLERTIGRGNIEADWGIEIPVVQVAQVYIVDGELRRQLEAEVRNQVLSTSQLSDLKVHEEITLARSQSERRTWQENLENERERSRVASEQQRLQYATERERLQLERELGEEKLRTEHDFECLETELEAKKTDLETPLLMEQMSKQMKILAEELKLRELQKELRQVLVTTDLLEAQSRQELRKRILPQEQIPELARALSGILQGANLSVYGDGSEILRTFKPVLDLLSQQLTTFKNEA